MSFMKIMIATLFFLSRGLFQLLVGGAGVVIMHKLHSRWGHQIISV